MSRISSTSGACVRFDTDGPYLHENTIHQSPLVTDVFINDRGELQIEHGPSKEVAAISAITVSPDETLAGTRGIIGGGSGGNDRTRVRFYSTHIGRRLDLNDSKDYALMAGPYSNAWVAWTHMVDAEPADQDCGCVCTCS